MTPNQVEYLLRSLRLLETVGRCGSFSAAALELGMSQPAVSQQIAQLEKILGVTLFERRHRGVSSTDNGKALYTTVTEVLSKIHTVMDKIYEQNTREKLTILTDYGFAANWLLPRLSDFEEQCPDVDISLLTTQVQQDRKPDQHTPPADLSILFGEKPQVPEQESFCLFSEEIYPVCSPNYLEQAGPFTKHVDIARGRLLHLSGPDRKWFTWEDWFKAVSLPTRSSIPLKNSLSFGNYPLLLQAVLQGQGIGLGWRPLIDDLLGTKQIVPIYAEPLRSSRGYFVSVIQKKKEHTAFFIEWIIREAQKKCCHLG
ncbi:LysR family transcriptional regulator [Acetobacter tropicalis]|uniref:HTH lysR-type domain-containing protein n=1 Tax=Acetobacter tropicalis TaxID=104102 RepID=A0A252AD74_9PROT|nr:LysR family transcriptional regulator [Acetobacter tropicalis]OUI87485.1 hypothetical protein HC62_14140 [Acetobacter tropicalis]